MTVGSQTDIYNRLIQQLPSWFGTNHAVLDALLAAFVGYNDDPNKQTTSYFHYNSQYLYSVMQQRIQTATDINLDLISQDYLGSTLPRKTNENDDSFRKRILANVVREKATRKGMSDSIETLTGYKPLIWEPFGGLGVGYLNVPQTLALNVPSTGGLGTFAPYQAWIYVYISAFQGMAGYPGVNTSPDIPNYYQLGLNVNGQLGSPSLENAFITQSDVWQLIENTKVLGTLMHVFFLYV